MVKYGRDKNPRCLMRTSTNAHYFESDAKARAAVESGIDLICCSIDGTTQDVYERGKTRGNLEKAPDGMKRLIRIKTSTAANVRWSFGAASSFIGIRVRRRWMRRAEWRPRSAWTTSFGT